MSIPLRRKLLYSTILLASMIATLLLIEAGVRWAERQDLVQTHRQDDLVHYVEGDLFRLDEEGEHWVSTDYLRMSAPPNRIRVHKGQAWRMMTTGGSFVRGMPYGDPDGTERPGTMQFWLRQRLTERYPQAEIEVVNLGASGQNSSRVLGFVKELVQLDPDLLFVATCNNEGALPPGRVMSTLHDQASYRLLVKWLVPEPDAAERSTFMLQDPDTEAVRQAFRANLEAIVRTAGEARVPLLLATLPVHLRYTGDDWGNVLEQGFLNDQVERRNADACILAGIELYQANQLKQAEEQLQRCENKAEALRWMGLCAYRRYRFDQARAMLEQSVELIPRGRCRPSFNEIIREVAAASPGVVLVDLDAATRAAAPHGIPGPELFHDNCHMTWDGYETMARTVQEALQQAGLEPPGSRSEGQPRDRLSIAGEHDLLSRHDPRTAPRW
jgi:hypothetical protein